MLTRGFTRLLSVFQVKFPCARALGRLRSYLPAADLRVCSAPNTCTCLFQVCARVCRACAPARVSSAQWSQRACVFAVCAEAHSACSHTRACSERLHLFAQHFYVCVPHARTRCVFRVYTQMSSAPSLYTCVLTVCSHTDVCSRIHRHACPNEDMCVPSHLSSHRCFKSWDIQHAASHWPTPGSGTNCLKLG